MTTVELVTLTVSCIAIGASVVSIMLFVLYSMLQRRLIVSDPDTKLPDDIASVVRLFKGSLSDDVPDDHRRVLRAVVRRYSQTALVSVLDDRTERSYLFRALTNPETLPWEYGGAPTTESTQQPSEPQK